MSYEKQSEEMAARIIENDGSPFVTDDVMRTWIKTALLEAYAKGRIDVFREEQASILARAAAASAEGKAKATAPRNRHERRAAAKGAYS